jgi:nucleotide-binding universal stress UspA family protein
MQARHVTVLSTLLRVQRFMDINANTLGSVTTSVYRHALDDSVTTLKSQAVTLSEFQRKGHGQPAKQRALRSALRDNHMRRIAIIAAVELRQAPEFVTLQMPAPNLTTQQLVAAAEAMRVAAQQYVSTFTDGGLPADFLEQLQAAADVLAQMLADHGPSTTTQAAVTAELGATAASGRGIVRVLDPLIQAKLAGNAGLLAQWKTAKRFIGKVTPVPASMLQAAAIGANALQAPVSEATNAS